MKVRFEDGDFMVRLLRDNFNTQPSSDVTIALKNGEKLFCHKGVLSMGSSVLRKMFQSGMRETTVAEFPIDGAPHAVECMLRFLYTGHCNLDDENIAAVTAVADYFDVQPLHEFCLRYIDEYLKVTYKNCLELLKSGFEHKVDKVFAIAAKHVIEIEGLCFGLYGFSYPLLEALLQQAKGHHCSHMNLFRLIYCWMAWCCTDDEVEKGVTLLMKLDLGTLSFSELAEVCSKEVVQSTAALQLAVVEAMSLKHLRLT